MHTFTINPGSGSSPEPPAGPETAAESFARVVAILRRLRAPGGCPWDREQTFDSIRPHTLEEAYEVLEAIGDRNWSGLEEELGDLLLQVLFYADMAAEEGRFTLTDVLRQLADKLVRRHPHVFADATSSGMSPEQALGRWEAIKAQERGNKGEPAASRMAGIPKGLPALAEAAKMGGRAARVGFDWPSLDGVWRKLEEESRELHEQLAHPMPDAGEQRRRLEDELGDMLFTLVNLARHLELEPESALKRASLKFRRRFERMELAAQAQHRDLEKLSAREWDELWEEAKAAGPPR